ncbi:exodeoxyribonuclease VII large subunit [Bacillus coahuilensis m2-6]|uniref:exodeoxyribonuclease VII large subunit n=1 Tax=Bacillus coahuilensis TaxID=408580 RepID=UPI0007501D54|nr:exodeoxyribonuclease VII large subunit [Bacillus coahuilensis]KUP07360.1 exodeoxyribonuclease VII large subunit [Bacillus coahuilensis m2-6]
MTEDRYLSIGALTKYIKRKFERDPHLTGVHIRGELSNFKSHSSGHLYFTLKDDKARISSIMFASSAKSLKFNPENGMKVLVTGDVTVYESGGQYQIYVKTMEPDGIGALYLAYEQLKENLEQEGLFDTAHKKPLPLYPRVVGVVTSPTGAAVRDIITTIKRRYPIAKILVLPALVQGGQAAPSIVKAIAQANSIPKMDVIIVGRGGGSIEELWAFNEEAVARAIFQSNVPVISAVGHETDFTIADFVADQRAPTPTAAAELAVPHIEEITERVLSRELRLNRAVNERIRQSQTALKALTDSYALRNPKRLYEQHMERLDRLTESLGTEQNRMLDKKSEQLKGLARRLEFIHPGKAMSNQKEQLDRLTKQQNYHMKRMIESSQKELYRHIAMLDALSPLKILERGYSVLFSEEKQVVKSIAQVDRGDKINVRLADGELYCEVVEKE